MVWITEGKKKEKGKKGADNQDEQNVGLAEGRAQPYSSCFQDKSLFPKSILQPETITLPAYQVVEIFFFWKKKEQVTVICSGSFRHLKHKRAPDII